jgi:CheY-like chemotaxis protein
VNDPAVARSEAPPRRVLVVEDEPAIRALCRVNLQLAGMEVVEAGDGREALDVLAHERFDVVVLDLMLPELDGWEVAERLRSNERTRDVPIVALSARAAHSDIERAHAVGADSYITKPFDPTELAEYLERTIDRVAAGEREELRREMLAE